MKYYLDLKQETHSGEIFGSDQEWHSLNLSQGGMNIGGCGVKTPFTEEQLNAINGLLSTIYDLNDPDFQSEDDIKHYQQWASKYIEVLKSRIEVEEKMINHLK